MPGSSRSTEKHGRTEVREIKGNDPNGAWITGCLTASLMGYVRIPRSGQVRFMARVRDIIARKDEILAARAKVLAPIMDDYRR